MNKPSPQIEIEQIDKLELSMSLSKKKTNQPTIQILWGF